MSLRNISYTQLLTIVPQTKNTQNVPEWSLIRSHLVSLCIGNISPPILPSHMIICTAHYIIMSFFCIQKQKNNLQFYFICCVVPKWEAKPLQRKSLSSSLSSSSSSPTHEHHHHHRSQLLNWKLADLAFQDMDVAFTKCRACIARCGSREPCTTRCGACIARCGNLHYTMWSLHCKMWELALHNVELALQDVRTCTTRCGARITTRSDTKYTKETRIGNATKTIEHFSNSIVHLGSVPFSSCCCNAAAAVVVVAVIHWSLMQRKLSSKRKVAHPANFLYIYFNTESK